MGGPALLIVSGVTMVDADVTSVCAVAVAFLPDGDSLRQLVDRIATQVAEVVVVDNGGGTLPGLAAVQLVQPTNIGLAAAQNAGIAYARSHGHTHVVLLDQDSLPAPDMVASLVDAVTRLSAAGHRVGAVGPRFHDSREERDAPFVKVGFPVSKKMWCRDEPQVQCDFLIASGALIPMAVLDDVGGMAGGMFIDNVDLEWSFRVRSRGYLLYGVCGATMTHRLGDDRRPVLFGLRHITTHGPVRLYYIMRNRLMLYRLPQTPRVWTAQDLLRVPVKFLLFSVLIGPRRRNARFMVRGLFDGIRGRQGPCPMVSAR